MEKNMPISKEGMEQLEKGSYSSAFPSRKQRRRKLKKRRGSNEA
jgi:hypothetical protein